MILRLFKILSYLKEIYKQNHLVPQSVVDALAALKASVQSVDDLVADVAPSTPTQG